MQHWYSSRRTKLSKVVALFLVMTLLAPTVIACARAETKPSIVQGFVTLDTPVAGATVSILGTEGKKLFEQKAATTDGGAFRLEVKKKLPADFRIVADGGSRVGTLAADVRGYDAAALEFYTLNPVTTLMAKYRDQHPDLDQAAIEDKVWGFLDMPSGIRLVSNTRVETSTFSPTGFMSQADASGGVDTFVGILVAEIDAGKTRAFPGAPANFGFSALADLAKEGIKTIASSALRAAASKGTNMVLDMVLEAFGFGENPSDPEVIRRLDEIKEQLGVMDAKLDEIQTTLIDLQRQLDEIKAAITESQIDTRWGIMARDINKIKNGFNSYMEIAERAKSNPAGEAANVDRFFNGDYRADVIKEALLNINSQVLGQGGGRATLLSLAARHLNETNATRSWDSAVHQAAYEKLEGYMTDLLMTEIKGAWLVAEQLVYRSQRDGSGQADAQRYLEDTFKPSILEPQLEGFQVAVEWLVLSQRSTRWAEFLPEQTSVMLAPAYRFGNEFRYGFDTRVQGDQVVPNNTRTLTVGVQYLEKTPPAQLTYSQMKSPETATLPREATTTVNAYGKNWTIARYHAAFPDGPSGSGFRSSPGQVPGLYDKVIQFSGPNATNTTQIVADWWPDTSKNFVVVNRESNKVLQAMGGPRPEAFYRIWWSNQNSAAQQWRMVQELQADPFLGAWQRGIWENRADPRIREEVQTRFPARPGDGPNGVYRWQGGAFWGNGGPADEKGVWMSTTSRINWVLQRADTGKYYTLVSPNGRGNFIMQWRDFNGNADSYSNEGALWRFHYVGNGYFTILGANGGNVLSVAGSSKAAGAIITQDTSNDAPNQLWMIDPMEPNSFWITNKNSGLNLVIDGGSRDDFARVTQGSGAGGTLTANWRLYPRR